MSAGKAGEELNMHIDEDSIALSEADARHFEQMVAEENMAMAKLADFALAQDAAAEEARGKRAERDAFCVSLEKKYGAAGKKWTYDPKEKRIKFK